MKTHLELSIFRKVMLGVTLLLFGLAEPVIATETVLSFSGTDSYVDLGSPGALQFANNSPLTVEGWIYLNSSDVRDMLYSKNIGRTTTGYTHMFGFYENGRIAAFTGSVWQEPNPKVTVDIQRWVHVAFSFDGTTMTYYLDGAQLERQLLILTMEQPIRSSWEDTTKTRTSMA